MNEEINYIIEEHTRWIQSKGMTGKQIEINNMIFENKTIANRDLSVAIFFDCRFIKCTFVNVDFSDACFIASYFEKCSFLNCMMSKSDFSETILVESKMKECIAIKANFYKARIEAVSIEKSDIRAINFIKANLLNSNIIKNNMSNGVFKETCIVNTEFNGIVGIDACRVTSIYTDDECKIKVEGKNALEYLGY